MLIAQLSDSTVGIIVFALVILAVVTQVVLWQNRKHALGAIRCKRCGHVGPAGRKATAFQWSAPVCSQCQSEDWEKADQINPA